MDAMDIFGNIVILLMFGVILVAILGGDPSPIIQIAPDVILLAFAAAIGIAIARTVI